MQCLYCSGQIGWFRRLTDNEFCCAEHRVKMAARSARALRNRRESAFYEDDEVSSVFVKRIDILSTEPKKQTQSSMSSSMIFGLLLVGAIFVGSMGLPEGGAAPESRAGRQGASRKIFGSPLTARKTDDFSGGASSWIAAGGSSRPWVIKNGLLQPGSLRIWSDSTSLVNYNVEFVGQIEHKAMSWAYRAKDSRNYYASKLLISKPGPLPSLDLVRYAVINGAEYRRTRIPLTMNVRADTLYKVQMTVKGEDFSTMINGRMVDTWRDTRLTAGGVGFFADAGESALVRYITVSDRDSLPGRILSHFGLIHPAALPRP